MRRRAMRSMRLGRLIVIRGRRCRLCGDRLTTPKLGWGHARVQPCQVDVCERCTEIMVFYMAVKLWKHVDGMPDYSADVSSDKDAEVCTVI